MPDFGSQLFGSPAGMRQADADMQAKMLNTLSAQESTQRIQQNEAMNPLRQKQQEQENQARQQALESQKRQAELIARVNGQKGPEPTSPADYASKLSMAAFAQGMTSEGLAWGKQAGDMRKSEATARNQQVEQDIHKMTLERDEAQRVASIANGISELPPDQRQAAWHAALLDHVQRTGQGKELLSMPFSDELLKTVRDGALTEKERQEKLLEAQRQKSIEDNRRDEKRHRETEESLTRARDLEQKRHHAATEKAGGAVTYASKAEQDEAREVILKDHPDASPEDLQMAASNIASRAKVLAQNPGLTRSQAVARAWQEQKNDWTGLTKTDVVADAQKGRGGKATEGARGEVFTQRIVTSANEAIKELKNVVQLPMSASTGWLAGRGQSTGITGATKEVLANKATSQEVQLYNVMSSGIQRNLASIEAVGLMPSGSLTHMMDAVIMREGDTNLTKAAKLAQTRQIIEAGLEPILSNPRVEEEKKDFIRKMINQVKESVPFTQQDIIKLAESGDSKATLGSIMKGKGDKKDAPMTNAKGWKLHQDAKGNRAYVSPDGKEFEEPK